jgi:hypothetical protein
MTDQQNHGQNHGMENLLALARIKSRKSRSELIEAIDEFYSGGGDRLTERDRMMMEDIIRTLIRDVEISVRQTLSVRLADRSDAPRDLVVLLASDEIDVAHPILIRSDVLRDSDLMEIVQQRTMEHQIAIAQRPSVSTRLSDGLVETDRPEVIETLLENPGAEFSQETMGRLIDSSREITRYQRPLTLRSDIPQPLVRKLYWGVSAALRVHLLDTYDLDPDELDDALESVTREILDESDAAGPAPAKPQGPTPKGSPEKTDEAGLIQTMENGSVFEFLDQFTKVAKLRQQLLKRLMFETGGEGLAVLCKALGLSATEFGRIFLYFRGGRLGDKIVEEDEARTARAYFNKIEISDAIRTLKRWRRDQNYLDALRMVEESRPARPLRR